MATHQYRSPSIIVRPTTSASPSASVRKQQQTLLEHHLHHPRSSPSSSTAKSSTAKSSSVPVHPGQKEQQKRSKMSGGGGQKKKWGEDQMSDGDGHQLDGRMIKMAPDGPFLFVNSGGGGGDYRVRGRRETRRTEGGGDGSNILGLFANNSKPTAFDDHPRTLTSSFVIPKTNRQSEPKRIPELQQLQCSFCALSADYHHHFHHHHHNSSSSADDSLTSSSSSSNSITTGTSEDFCSLNSGGSCSCCSCRCCSASEESEQEEVARKKDKLMKSFKNEDEVITVKAPPLRCAGIGNQQQKTVPPPPPPPPPKMGLLKNSTASTTSSSSSSSKPSNKKKKGITFQEGGPVVIYREASDSEDEEEFFELSLKSSELNSSSEENSPSSPPSSQTSSADFDEEHDPERIKLRQLTEANTFFNSNYANFKLTEAASVGLGRASKGDSNSSSGGPIKFVIQDGYQQPLPPTKYKAAAAANLKKSLFEEKNNCDNKAGGNKSTSTSTVVKPTSAPPPLPPTTPSSSSSSLPSKPIVSLAKPVIEAKKPSVLVAQSSSSSSPLKSSPSPLSPSSKSPSSSSSSSSSEIPTIRIPRAAINADKLNRSPPPAFANSNSANPLKQALLEKTPTATTKPEKPPKNISLSKPTVEKPAKEASPPPPPANIMKPSFDTTDSALPPPPPKPEHLVQQQQQLPCNSVSLLDENDGTILPLDTQKLPEELKSDVADVRLDQGQLYLLRNGSKQHGAELQQQQQLPEKIPEKLLKKSIKKESTKSVAEDCCFSDDSSSSSASDSGASGCSPSSASPTAQLLEDDRSTTSTSPSPTDSLDSADTSSSPESYESASPELSTSPVPPPPLSPPSKSSPPQPQMSSPLSPPPPPPPPSISPPAQQSSSSSAVSPDSPRNSTMISISYRRSSSNGSSVSGGSSTEPAPVKRNEMLAKLAMDLEQHRAAGDAKKKSTSTKEVTLQQQQQQTLVINQNNNNNNNYIINNNNNRTPQQQQQQQTLPGFADLEKPSKPSNVPLSKREQFLADCYGDDDDDDELTNSKSKRSFFARKNDSSDDSSDSECDPLPDMIKSDEEEEEEDDFENISDSDDCSEKKNHSAFGRRLSKDSGATTKSSSSSLGSKQSKENGGNGNKSVSALLRNVVQGSNTKKYTKLMRKNISKTSKFIVNTSKQIGSETSDMVRKLKDKSGGSGSNEKHDNYYYPEEYHHQTVKEPKATKSKSKWTFSPNAQQQQSETASAEAVEVTNFQKKKANKFEPMYAFAKSAYKNIEEKMKTSGGQTGSKSSSAVGQAELPIDPFGGSGGGNSSSNLNSNSDAPALLKIKRLDSSYIEPNYSEPNLLQNQNKVPTKAATVQSESSLVKPPLPPRNYRVSPEEEEEVQEIIASTATVPPPQAPLRRKKLAKKRDQIVEDSSTTSSSSKIEPTILPQKAETEVFEAAEKSISSLSQLKAAYESYYRVFSTCQSSIEIFTAVNLQEGGQSKISSHNSNQIRLYRCAHRGEQFYLLSSKNLWTTVYDCGGGNQSTTLTFQDEPCRYLPIGFSRLYDIATFCRTVLYSSSNNSNQPNNHAHLVESLLLQLFSSLATFEEQCTGKSTGKSAGSNQNQAHKQLSIGDVNDCLVAVNEGENENALDVILLLPTKELEDSADSGDDSLSMMQSFCLQVFLLRLTSMISNEDGSFGEQQQQPRKSNGAQHYRALVRRNQSGITELRHLYLLGALDIFKVLPGSNKRNSGNGVKKMTAEAVERAISGWFEAMQGRNDLFAAAAATGGHSFAPGPVATYAQVQFAADRRNLVGAIELAKRELLQET